MSAFSDAKEENKDGQPANFKFTAPAFGSGFNADDIALSEAISSSETPGMYRSYPKPQPPGSFGTGRYAFSGVSTTPSTVIKGTKRMDPKKQ